MAPPPAPFRPLPLPNGAGGAAFIDLVASKIWPGQNVSRAKCPQEVRAKRLPVGQGKMSQGSLSPGKIRAICPPGQNVSGQFVP